MQETPGQSILQHALKEIDAVQDICDSVQVPYLMPSASQKDVLAALETCKIFHFAGHGGTHPMDPLQSRLLLNDWQDSPLSVASLLERNLQSISPFLAYLSACGTGQILDDRSVDESIHLTSAFQLAGFRHVIGTLWEVDDELCVDMARLTWEFMGDKGFSDESVSRGLHYAMRTLRDQWVNGVEDLKAKHKRDATLVLDETPKRTPTWVPYVHYGV
ncbi:TPR domain containing protein [Colletotrichum tofieldiae]|nr:TPR domain containing protein [Colletotrichum tofieldiae]